MLIASFQFLYLPSNIIADPPHPRPHLPQHIPPLRLPHRTLLPPLPTALLAIPAREPHISAHTTAARAHRRRRNALLPAIDMAPTKPPSRRWGGRRRVAS
jgi:hypothetical protein